MLPLTQGIKIDDSCFLAVKNSWHITRVPIPCPTTRAKQNGDMEEKIKELAGAIDFARHQKKTEESTGETTEVNYTYNRFATGASEDVEDEHWNNPAVAFMRHLPLRTLPNPAETPKKESDLTTKTDDANSGAAQCSSPPPVEDAARKSFIPEAQNSLNPELDEEIKTSSNNATLCWVPPPVKDETLSYFIKESHSFLFVPVVDTRVKTSSINDASSSQGHCSVPSPVKDAALFRVIDEAHNRRTPAIMETSPNDSSSNERHCSVPPPVKDVALFFVIDETYSRRIPTIVPPAETLALHFRPNLSAIESLKRKLAEAKGNTPCSFSPASVNEELHEQIQKALTLSVPSIIVPKEEIPASKPRKSAGSNEIPSSSKTYTGFQVGQQYLYRMCRGSRPEVNQTTIIVFLFVLVFYTVRRLRIRDGQQQTAASPKHTKAGLGTTMETGYDQALIIDTILVRSALAGGGTIMATEMREPDLHKRVVKEWLPLLPILKNATSRHKHGCHLLIRKLTRLSSMGTSTDRLLGFIEEWMSSIKTEEEPIKYRSMIKDLYLFLQVKYELPGNAVITLLPFVMANASVEDICCERRLGKIIFAAEAKLGDFFEEKSTVKTKSASSSSSGPNDKTGSTKNITSPPMPNRDSKSPSSKKGMKVSFASTSSCSQTNTIASSKEKCQESHETVPEKESTGDPQAEAKKTTACTNAQQESATTLGESDHPLLLDVSDVTDRDALVSKATIDNSECCSTKKDLLKIKLPRQDGKDEDKLPVHGSSQRRSPRSKDTFVQRFQYIQATKKLQKKKQKSKQKCNAKP